MSPIRERPLLFRCEAARLVGVLGEPAPTRHEVGVLIVVGGPQVRAGSHRQFVLLARSLTDAGYASLRFDVRGMGDSEGEPRDFMAIESDIAAAIDALLAANPQLRHVVLWGLCDGASASLMYWAARRDPRVRGLCLLNPWLRSEVGQARTQVRHYYLQRLLQRDFWRKFFSGGIGAGAASGLLQAIRKARGQPQAPAAPGDFRSVMAQAWREFPGPILLLLSGKDYTAQEFLDGVGREPAWHQALHRPGLHRVDLPSADHTFSATSDRVASERALIAWLAQECA